MKTEGKDKVLKAGLEGYRCAVLPCQSESVPEASEPVVKAESPDGLSNEARRAS